jgi:hypothetical protein
MGAREEWMHDPLIKQAMADAPAGWYPDPSGAQGKRYWDGNTWSDAIPGAAKSSGGVNWPIVIIISVVVLGLGAACIAGINNVAKHEDGSTYPADWQCIDPTPKKDGACRVSGGGVLDTGLSPGWIRSAGPRPGMTTCSWRRLNGPSNSIEHTIDLGGEKSGPIEVHMQAGDYAFWSEGCQPWQRVSND